MNFVETPLGVLVKLFRDQCKEFNSVDEASTDFLDFLARHGREAPLDVRLNLLDLTIRPWFHRIKERAQSAFVDRYFASDAKDRPEPDDFQEFRSKLITEQIAVVRTALEKLPDAIFIDGDSEQDGELYRNIFTEICDETFEDLSEDQLKNLAIVADLLFRKPIGPTNTGVIIAGYGRNEIFPTLIHYEIFGVIGTRLKFVKRDEVDIDRGGTRAKVLPFAQKEMVERFLYGLDGGIRTDIERFCRASIPLIRTKLLEKIELSDDDLASLNDEAEAAEEAFLNGLVEESFDLIRRESEVEIEGMVEFMPKPELARMAEALVDLTSIKRRVSVGYETVGGPIDVAVISKSEGFVWVKRKHYFPADLNHRFFARKGIEPETGAE